MFMDTVPKVGSEVFLKTELDDKLGPSIEDQKFLKLMNREFDKDLHGHWIAPLPFRSTRPCLSNNKQLLGELEVFRQVL